MMQPNFSSKARISSAGIAAPPDMQMRSDGAVGARRTTSEWSIALYIVGTPWKSVTRSRSMISSALSGSKRGSIVTVAPDADRAVHRAGLPERVEQREGAEEHVVLAHLAELLGHALAEFLYRFECVSSAPFGLPVVPDV